MKSFFFHWFEYQPMLPNEKIKATVNLNSVYDSIAEILLFEWICSSSVRQVVSGASFQESCCKLWSAASYYQIVRVLVDLMVTTLTLCNFVRALLFGLLWLIIISLLCYFSKSSIKRENASLCSPQINKSIYIYTSFSLSFSLSVFDQIKKFHYF